MPARERTFRVEAIVLRHKNWGEADRLLVLYTLEMGKLRAIAKGIRKPRSRKAGHLEPLMRSSLLMARGYDLPIVTQAETINAFLPLRENILLTTYATYAIELLDRFTYEEGENPNLYRLLTDTLTRLCISTDPNFVSRYYEIRLLDLLGFRPQLFQCMGCEVEIKPENQFFSAEQGGVLCPKCGQGINGLRPVSMNALRYLRYFQRNSYSVSARAPLPAEVNRELEILMEHYLTYLLESGLNTPHFLRRLRKETGEIQNHSVDS